MKQLLTKRSVNQQFLYCFFVIRVILKVVQMSAILLALVLRGIADGRGLDQLDTATINEGVILVSRTPV